MHITPSDQAFGANVTDIDLTQPLSGETVADIRAAWLEHHVLAFPDQAIDDDDLERFTLYFGPFGDDPFIKPIPGRKHVIAVERRADETSTLFAENWHSDWSFQEKPPAGTCLRSVTVPPVGGDTGYADGHAALDAMPGELRAKLEGKLAIHSARNGYGPQGLHGERDGEDRSMDILSSEDALSTQLHPLVREHPETGRLGIFGTVGYIIGIEGMSDDDARDLLVELYQWQTRPEFQYVHRWQADMVVMWDNRSVLHRAMGGFEGHDRLLHRTTIGAL